MFVFVCCHIFAKHVSELRVVELGFTTKLGRLVDTLFVSSNIPVIHMIFAGNSEQLFDSVHDKIFTLPDHFSIYPGHDYNGKYLCLRN